MIGKILVITMSALTLATAVTAGPLKKDTMKEDKNHVQTWNDFARNLFNLHKKQLMGNKIRKTSVVGGYDGQPAFYKEVRYYDASRNLLLSKIQWEMKNPQNIHTIEVYVYDDKGRVVRDYVASFLPHYRNAPVQALINLHAYKGGVHGMRQFDASGDRTYETCEGTFKGKKVQFRLFEDDLDGTDADIAKLMKSPLYAACMYKMPKAVGKNFIPH
jgi:hypothetical protein